MNNNNNSNNNNTSNTSGNNTNNTTSRSNNGYRGGGGRGYNNRRNNGGRGSGGRRSGNNNRNNERKEKGATEELKHHVFDCSTRKNIEACNETLKQVIIYVGKEYGKNADAIKYVAQHLEDPDLNKPDEISDAEAKNKMLWFEWQEKMKRWMDRQEGLETGKKKLYTLVWGQCTKLMQNEIEASNDYKDMDKKQDPIKLIKTIKGITYNFRDQKYLPGSMWRTYKNLFNTTQREDEDLKSYYDRFQNAVDVLENYGADIGALSKAYKEEFNSAIWKMIQTQLQTRICKKL